MIRGADSDISISLVPTSRVPAEDVKPRSRSRGSSLVKHSSNTQLSSCFSRIDSSDLEHLVSGRQTLQPAEKPSGVRFLIYPLLSSWERRLDQAVGLILAFPVRIVRLALAPHFAVRAALPTGAPLKTLQRFPYRLNRIDLSAIITRFDRICLANVRIDHQ